MPVPKGNLEDVDAMEGAAAGASDIEGPAPAVQGGTADVPKSKRKRKSKAKATKATVDDGDGTGPPKPVKRTLNQSARAAAGAAQSAFDPFRLSRKLTVMQKRLCRHRKSARRYQRTGTSAMICADCQ
jgi:superfamily II helicase